MSRVLALAFGVLLASAMVACAAETVNVARSGMGGAMGMCDPDRGLAFGYVMNKMHAVSNIGPRVMRLIEAVYGCI